MALALYELAGKDGRRFSPYCWRARLALAHKGLEAALLPVRFTEKASIAFSGQKLVPVLTDGANTIADSWAIAGYLEEAYPERPSLFGCATGRACARFVHFWLESQVFPPLFRAVVADIYDHIDPADRDYFRATREKRLGCTLEETRAQRTENLERFRAALEPVRKSLAERPYLSGDEPAYPDYLVFSLFQWVRGSSPLAVVAPDDPVNPWRCRMLDLYDGLARSVPAYDY